VDTVPMLSHCHGPTRHKLLATSGGAHLIDFNERILVGCQPLPSGELLAWSICGMLWRWSGQADAPAQPLPADWLDTAAPEQVATSPWLAAAQVALHSRLRQNGPWVAQTMPHQVVLLNLNTGERWRWQTAELHELLNVSADGAVEVLLATEQHSHWRILRPVEAARPEP
jgi:hypothetical protein